MEKVIKGELFGVRFEKRDFNDPHVCIQLLGNGDDNEWFKVGESFSSYWLTGLIDVLQQAQRVLEQSCEPDKGGYTFRKEDQ